MLKNYPILQTSKIPRIFGQSPVGFMSCVVSYDLGRRCLDLLRRMMLSSDQCRRVKSMGESWDFLLEIYGNS